MGNGFGQIICKDWKKEKFEALFSMGGKKEDGQEASLKASLQTKMRKKTLIFQSGNKTFRKINLFCNNRLLNYNSIFMHFGKLRLYF